MRAGSIRRSAVRTGAGDPVSHAPRRCSGRPEPGSKGEDTKTPGQEDTKIAKVARGLPASAGIVDIVVKLGGGVLAHAEHFALVLAAISSGARERRLLVVPGGGPFADTVRDVDRRLSLSDDAAHWMAVLAMDQHAYLVASKLADGMLVTERREIAAALDAQRVPVLAPSRWLRGADPLSHTWSVTSDTIAAWVAGEVGASSVILIKPPGAAGGDLVDSCFARALPAHIAPVIVPADQLETLRCVFESDGPALGGPYQTPID
jgi:aspartokinase-like uncharacterized kinase